MFRESLGRVLLDECGLDEFGKICRLLLRGGLAPWDAGEAVVAVISTAVGVGKRGGEVEEDDGACKQATEGWYKHDDGKLNCGELCESVMDLKTD